MLRATFGAVRRALHAPVVRGMAVNAQSVLYTDKGLQPDQTLAMAEETEQLASPGKSQVQLRFLAAACLPEDIAAISSNSAPATQVSTSTIKKRYASVLAVEPFTAGYTLPAGPAVGGVRGVAVVEAVGSGVKGLKAGDWVLPSPGVGVWRTHAVVPADALTVVPDDIPAWYAAVLGGAPATALKLLDDAKLKKGDWIVLNGAYSLTGQAMVQLAKARGLKILALIAKEGEIAYISPHLKALGADIVVPYEQISTYQMKEILAELPAPKIAFDGVGGPAAAALARILPKGGTMVSYGAEATEPALISASRETKVVGFSYPEWEASASPAEKAKMMASLAGMVKDGSLKLLLETIKFEDYKLGLRLARESLRERRIVLTMPLEHFGYKDGSPGEWVIFQEINKEAAASGFTGPSFEKMDPASQSRVRERVKERMAHLYPEFKRQSEYIENHPRTKTIRNIKAKFGEILGKTATENLTDAQLAEINKAIMQEGSKTDPDWQRKSQAMEAMMERMRRKVETETGVSRAQFSEKENEMVWEMAMDEFEHPHWILSVARFAANKGALTMEQFDDVCVRLMGLPQEMRPFKDVAEWHAFVTKYSETDAWQFINELIQEQEAKQFELSEMEQLSKR